ncbi:VapC toxin family PIN domain ribonuclease [Nocardia asteroides]|uniref:VapC toxin family PIN domain ribonuclease n=1 Tax=Nocardia asteroides TaxID=1824 RepID=UPI0037C96B65
MDSSALWRILRSGQVHELWRTATIYGDVRACYPQRAEFLSSARDLKEYSELRDMYDDLYREVSVPKSASTWITKVQHLAAKAGCLTCFSAVDLQICATAAHHGLTIVHDDRDFVTATRFAAELREVNVHDGPLNLGI